VRPGSPRWPPPPFLTVAQREHQWRGDSRRGARRAATHSQVADIEDLRAGLRGELISAEQSAYDAARRLWNPSFDRKPALIVRCVGAADVRRAVSFTAAHAF